MFASVTSVALVGVEPSPVRVEVHVGAVTEKRPFILVGLPDTAVREARERVRSALASSGYRFPGRRVTVNLAPADLPKAGSAYDLPIALGLLAASGDVPPAAASVVALGELALDGRVRSARGGLAAALVAKRGGLRCLLPEAALGEASLARSDVRGVESLAQAVAVALGQDRGTTPADCGDARSEPAVDISSVRGHSVARRALEVAAAGGHHLFMTGPPGAGKTLLARCLPGLLPRLDDDAALAVAQAWAAAGREAPSLSLPPFRSPHHSATPAAIVGGGSGVPVPGELSLAHRGVLFMDELGEFPSHLLDMLRQPIEEGRVHIARKGVSVTFPCDVQLVAATNPCPCGFRDDRLESCRCGEPAVRRYRRRLSGPLLDRFDMRIEVPRIEADDLLGPPGESSVDVRQRVVAARRRQQVRGRLNRELSRSALDTLEWSAAARARLRTAIDRLALTARGWDRVRRVSRTIADLEDAGVVSDDHVAEALAFREVR